MIEDLEHFTNRNGLKFLRKLPHHRASLSIINECTVDCGENVGGTTVAPAAPEVAADDDGGGGDGDPEPERRPGRPRQSRHTVSRHTLPPAAEHFDRLSDSAHIDIASLKAITGKSRATLYRWIEKGLLPKPRKLGSSNNFWTAGEIRRALQPAFTCANDSNHLALDPQADEMARTAPKPRKPVASLQDLRERGSVVPTELFGDLPGHDDLDGRAA